MSNVAAEKVFLSGLVQFPEKLFEFAEYLDEDDFEHSTPRMTYEAIRSLIIDKEAQKITKAKIVSEAKSLGHQNYLSATRNGEWVDELFAEEITVHEIDNHFLEVKRQAIARAYRQSFQELRNYLDTTSDPLSAVISTVENEIISKVNMIDKGEHAIVDMREGFKEFLEELADDPGHIGLDLGYPILQERIGRIRNGSLHLGVATTGSGKSQFGLDAAVAAALMGLPVLYLDSELDKHSQWVRMASILARIPSDIVESGFWKMDADQLRDQGLDQQQINEILAYGRRLRDPKLWERVERLPIYYQSISGLSVPDVEPHMRRWLLTHVKPSREAKMPQCLIVYDYIKLAMTSEMRRGVLQEWQQNGLFVAQLHDFIQKYNIPMIAFGQTNNEADEGIRAVAGGKRISENVDSVFYIKRKTDRERAEDPVGTHKVSIWKSRFGRGLHDAYINFEVDLSCGNFQELEIGSVRQDNNDDDSEEED